MLFFVLLPMNTRGMIVAFGFVKVGGLQYVYEITIEHNGHSMFTMYI